MAPRLLLALLLAPPPAGPSEDERTVEVESAAGETFAPSTSLDEEHLAQSHGEGLADTISSISGVTTLRSTTGMAKPIIRGQVGRRTLILFDGVRHEGQTWGLDHAPEIDPWAASRITVVKGSTTTRFGPDAIGGVVLVDPAPLRRRPGISGSASTIGFSNPLGGGIAARLDGAHARVPGLAWRIESNVARHRATVTPDYPLDNTGFRTWNAGARLGWAGKRFEIEAAYRYMDVLAGICSCLRVTSAEDFLQSLARGEPLGSDRYSPEFAIERPKQEVGHHVGLVESHIMLGRAGELHATYAYQYNSRDEYDVVRDDIDGPQLEFDLGTHTGIVHYHQPHVSLSRRWEFFGVVDANVSRQDNEFESANTLIPDYGQWAFGLSAVERIVGERVEFEAGGRYDGLDRRAALEERDFLGLRAGGRLDEEECERTNDGGATCTGVFHTGSASFGVHGTPIRLMPNFDLRLHLSSDARIPAIDEHYMNGSAPSFPILGMGDMKLGVERTWGSTASATHDGKYFFASGSGFFNYVDDYIYFAAEPQAGDCAPLTCTTRGPYPVFTFRPIEASFAGGEGEIEFRMPRLPFEVGGDAAWVRARNLDEDGFISFVPADRYRVFGRWRWPDTRVSADGFLGLDATFTARQRRWDPKTDFAEPPDGYVLLGASAGVEFPGATHVVRLHLRGNNLLNRRYREYTSLLRYFADEPGIEVQLRLSVDFDLNS